MILPERTVDAWTAAYITGRRWRARLWAPTERFPGERYDLGVGFGNVGGGPVPPHRDPWPDKVFVLEHKGVDEGGPGSGPIVWIRVRQLLDHLAEDRARGGGLVYYLLPDPEWRSRRSARYGILPAVAWRRTRGPTLPLAGRYAWEGFQRWAFVVHVEDLCRFLAAIHVAVPGRFRPRAASEARHSDWACPLKASELSSIPNGVSLRDFVSGVRRCTHGRRVSDLRLGGPQAGAWLADRLGSSSDTLRDALLTAVEGERERHDVELEDQPDLPPRARKVAAEDMSEVFARPASTTVYGVGDSEQARG